MQVEHIRLTLGLKALGFQPFESTSLSKFVVSDVFNLHPYTADEVEELAEVQGVNKYRLPPVNHPAVSRCRLNTSG